MENVGQVIAFILAHWEAISVLLLAILPVVQAIQGKAYKTALMIALNGVREAAVLELKGVEKRKVVVDHVMKALPVWAKKFVTPTKAEELAEKAYGLLRGELTEAKTLDQFKAENPSVDPTVPVVDEANLHVKSPMKIEE